MDKKKNNLIISLLMLLLAVLAITHFKMLGGLAVFAVVLPSCYIGYYAAALVKKE
ncbi:MAG: hypothetical protein U0525_04060 [Patescibacteria group bacterium]